MYCFGGVHPAFCKRHESHCDLGLQANTCMSHVRQTTLCVAAGFTAPPATHVLQSLLPALNFTVVGLLLPDVLCRISKHFYLHMYILPEDSNCTFCRNIQQF